MGERYTAQDFITAIPGTGGIVSMIARKVGCEWETARAWIDKYPAESAVLRNIKLAAQGEGDTADAKWYLAKKGKRRNYGDAVEVTGEGGGPVQTEIVIRYAAADD